MMQARGTHQSENALEQSINGLINKVNVSNIRIIIKELLKLNIGRGRSFVVSSVLKAQDASPTNTNVYAALLGAVNSRIPNIGYLILRELIVQLDSRYKKKDTNSCITKASFIAHLVNQRVAHETLAVQILTLLLMEPSENTVDIATALLKDCGQKLIEVSSQDVNAILAGLRKTQLEGQLSNNVKCKIEVMLQVWDGGFKDHPALIKELDLVPEEEQFTHDAGTVVKFEVSCNLIDKFGLFCIIPTLKKLNEYECSSADVLHRVIASLAQAPL